MRLLSRSQTPLTAVVVRSQALDSIVLGGMVLAAAYLGIFTRPSGLLASFWPANAVMLGLVVRFPRLATPPSWASATVAFVIADLTTGGTLFATVLLTAANLAGVLAGAVLFSVLSQEDRQLARPLSVILLVLVALGAAVASGAVGSLIGPILFGSDALRSFLLWSVTEFVNYVVILPVLLTLPRAVSLDAIRSIAHAPVTAWRLLPVVALLLSLTGSLLVGGPGAVAFPVLALLWCSVTYDRFITALLTLLFSAWTLTIISQGYLTPEISLAHPNVILSVRVGVALVAIAPLVVASVMTQRNELLTRLHRLATRDHLTDALNRGAFYEEATRVIHDAGPVGAHVSLLMLDIDHFKRINDSHGHAAGDRVLTNFARLARETLRDDDLIGRLGGEEFGVLLPGCSHDDALAVAERIRSTFEACQVGQAGSSITATVSIGAVVTHGPSDLAALMAAADGALYEAKERGRNRIVMKQIAA